MSTTALAGVGFSQDHLAVLWCNQLLQVISRALLDESNGRPHELSVLSHSDTLTGFEFSLGMAASISNCVSAWLLEGVAFFIAGLTIGLTATACDSFKVRLLHRAGLGGAAVVVFLESVVVAGRAWRQPMQLGAMSLAIDLTGGAIVAWMCHCCGRDIANVMHWADRSWFCRSGVSRAWCGGVVVLAISVGSAAQASVYMWLWNHASLACAAVHAYCATVLFTFITSGQRRPLALAVLQTLALAPTLAVLGAQAHTARSLGHTRLENSMGETGMHAWAACIILAAVGLRGSLHDRQPVFHTSWAFLTSALLAQRCLYRLPLLIVFII